MSERALGASFRDPSGYVFERAGKLHRYVAQSYRPHYERLIGSGLYGRLTDKRLLIAHDEREPDAGESADCYRILLPERVAFVSYPYEWCFSQLKDAALCTLTIQREALACDMTLKDASAYNVQFQYGHPVLIDTLSFEAYEEGEPWQAYRQFCEHFLAPLALMSRTDVRMASLLRSYLDGVPLDLAARLLPRRAWLNVHLLSHILLHARYQRRYQAAGERPAADDRRRRRASLSRAQLTNLLAGLEAAVDSLTWRPEGTQWAEYSSDLSYTDTASEYKRRTVERLIDESRPATVWDLGANTGELSRLASARGIATLAFDVDPACVERNYLEVKRRGESNLLPLLLDLMNPSPALGWAGSERLSWLERGRPDLVLALALVHHLAITNNVPLTRIAEHFADVAPALIIEFVPKSDAMVGRLLATREDIFPDYTREGFERAFRTRFTIDEACPVADSGRVLYRMTTRAR